MAKRPNPSASSANASRLRFRIKRLIDEQKTRADTTESLLNEVRNGKFNFGAFQMNTMLTRIPGATFGGPFSTSFTVGP